MPRRSAYLGDEVRQRVEHVKGHHVEKCQRSFFVLSFNGGGNDMAHPVKRDTIGKICDAGKNMHWKLP